MIIDHYTHQKLQLRILPLADNGSYRESTNPPMMADSVVSISEPFPISMISGRYLLFDIDVVTYLRRTHNMCGTLIGSIPQVPQQNTFMGLPVELMPEEAILLVKREIAYIVDDFAWHKQTLSTFKGAEREEYLSSLRSVGYQAKKDAEAVSRAKKEKHLGKHVARKLKEKSSEVGSTTRGDDTESLFSDDRPASPAVFNPSSANKPYAITPTTTYASSSPQQSQSTPPDPPVPSSYHLYAHLNSKGYFIMPGLRFGCDFNVYPGDPLRFHSHFAAVSYKWDEEISMIDLIGGGRLGTRVKKAFLIGGKDLENNAEDGEGDGVRTFSIEWGGM